jgi:hypothetical protein
MDDEEPKTSKSKSSHGSLARNRESPTEPRNRTLKNLTLFLPKLLKEVGKTGKMNSVKTSKDFPFEQVSSCFIHMFQKFFEKTVPFFGKKIFSQTFFIQ